MPAPAENNAFHVMEPKLEPRPDTWQADAADKGIVFYGTPQPGDNVFQEDIKSVKTPTMPSLGNSALEAALQAAEAAADDDPQLPSTIHLGGN